MIAEVVSVNINEKKGVRKEPTDMIMLTENFGVEGDAHASSEWHRQVSLLAIESIEKMRQKGIDVHPGDFAENITTEGIDLCSLTVGTRIYLGSDVETEVTQIGKKCHNRCAIYEQVGDCVMPREGIFVRVLRGGPVKEGDIIRIMDSSIRTE